MSEDASGIKDYPISVGTIKGPTRRQIAVNAAGVGAALGIVAAGTVAVAKGIHDEQPELTARIDYNAANVLREQQEVDHTKYFKQRREDDGYSFLNGERKEAYNRIIVEDGKNLNFLTEPNQSSGRIENFSPVDEADGSILGTPVYGDPFRTRNGEGNSDVTLAIDDKGVNRVGYYQRVKGVVNGKEVDGYLMEDPGLHVVKQIQDQTRNQKVIKVVAK